jgi:predicted RNase H-like nuclease (RuvC/YqgF family)
MSDIYNGRMIPLHIADKAIINCNKEIEKLQIDNARLKAEVERLRDGVETMTWNASGVVTTQWVRAVEYDRLKAEVERLTKAGDELERVLTSKMSSYEIGYASFQWRAAKEGKQP